MNPREVARAGRVLFDIVASRGEAEATVAGLDALAEAVETHGELRAGLTSPFVPASAKKSVLDALAAPLGLPDVLRRTLHVLADQDTLTDVPALARVVHALANEAAGRVEAAVTTATPLSADQLTGLRERLAAVTGKDVTVHPSVDPDVLGGVHARVGGLVFDGTLARQLARLEEQLVQRG